MTRFGITRTVLKTEVVCLCFDKTSAEAFNKKVTLSGTFKDDKAISRKAAKLIEQDPNIRFIEAVDTNVVTGVYGISEEDFFAHAVELDPASRKPLNKSNN